MTNRLTDRRKPICNLSHATRYSYGTDKNYEQKKSVKRINPVETVVEIGKDLWNRWVLRLQRQS